MESLDISYETKGNPQGTLRIFNRNPYEFKGNPYEILFTIKGYP